MTLQMSFKCTYLLQIAGSDHSPAYETEIVFLCKAHKKQVFPL